MSVEVIKLTTGEEIISELEDKGDVVELTNAMLVAVNVSDVFDGIAFPKAR